MNKKRKVKSRSKAALAKRKQRARARRVPKANDSALYPSPITLQLDCRNHLEGMLKAIEAHAAVRPDRNLQNLIRTIRHESAPSVDGALLRAIRIGQLATRMEANWLHAQAISKGRTSVTDIDVLAALAKYATQADAAESLCMTTRQLRNRLSAMGNVVVFP
jgi:hypothetical protein